MSDKKQPRPEVPDDDDGPITRLHIPYDMIIDPDRPKKPERVKLPPIVAVRWWCVGIAWLLVFAGALFILRARPLGFNIFLQMKGFTQSAAWDSFYTLLARIVLGVCAALCFIESAFLLYRQRKPYLSLLIPLAVSLILLAVSFFL